MLTVKELEAFEKSIKNRRIGIIGDFCVDIYWHADMTKSELSRETPHYPLPIVSERIYPGAGGNVANNLAALKPLSVNAVTIIGDDWRGMLLESCLNELHVDSTLFVRAKERFTNAYCKPMRKGISNTEYEDPRLDFENYSYISAETEQQVLRNLEKLAQSSDIICVADQFKCGIITKKVRLKLIDLAKSGYRIIVDSRYNIGEYTDCILKPNEVECWRAVYNDEGYINADRKSLVKAAELLSKKQNSTVFCTLGSQGSVVKGSGISCDISSVKLNGALDICGAGDTSLSAFTCAVAAGFDFGFAAEIAGMASAVTVRKIGITGTAAVNELIELSKQYT